MESQFSSTRIEFNRIEYDDPELASLIRAADAFTLQLYPEECCVMDSASDLASKNALILGALAEQQCNGVWDELVAIAAANFIGKKTAEVKRVFVSPEWRGQTIAERLLHELEQQLLQQGAQRLVLETGIYQPQAIALYKKLGFNLCDAYAPPTYSEELLAYSVFMEKNLRNEG